MAPSEALRKIFTAGRPLVEQWLDIGEQIAALREVATAEGLDWSQVKALLKAQIQDERDEVGDGKRVRKILDKADFATAYADMLGLANMNENNYSAEPDHDADGVIIEADEIQESRAIDAYFCGPTVEGLSPSLAGVEGDIDRQPIQPGTAAQTVTAMPVVASSAEHGAVESSATHSPETAHEYAPEASSPQSIEGVKAPIRVADDANAGGQNAIGASESGAPISEAADPDKSGVEQSASAPAPRKFKFNDTPHSDCLNPERCGGFSNLGLCPQCKAEAETARQIEEA